jgi:hypothetical protein
VGGATISLSLDGGGFFLMIDRPTIAEA